jgi:hypothetical protein
MNLERKNSVTKKFSLKILAIVILLLNFSINAQSNSGNNYEFDLTLVSEVHQGNSYFTLGGGLGNIESLIFEGNLIPNFILRSNKEAKLMAVVTPQIILRMYNEDSLPVRTPSYMPHITFYYSIGKELSINNFTIFGKIAHHSNGQEDEFYIENGEINYHSGNFSTNYFEVGVIKTFFDNDLKAAQFFSTSLEVHPVKLSDIELRELYSFYRWNTQFAIFKLPFEKSDNKKEKAKFSLKGQFTWLFGDVNDWDFFALDRIITSVTFYYHPSFLEDIGLFVQYYHGQDYYNIYFPKSRDIIRIGFMTDQFRF